MQNGKVDIEKNSIKIYTGIRYIENEGAKKIQDDLRFWPLWMREYKTWDPLKQNESKCMIRVLASAFFKSTPDYPNASQELRTMFEIF